MDLGGLLRCDHVCLHRPHGQGIGEPPLAEEQATTDENHPECIDTDGVEDSGEDDVEQAEPKHGAKHAGGQTAVGSVASACHVWLPNPLRLIALDSRRVAA